MQYKPPVSNLQPQLLTHLKFFLEDAEAGKIDETYDVKKVLKNTKDLADPNMVRFFSLSFKCIARPYQQFYFLIL